MALYAISDVHLSFTAKKPMDIFGAHWENMEERLCQNWVRKIKTGDAVLIPGDISWGLTLEEANADLEFLNALPGEKIMLRGNHDYWWKSISKLSHRYTTISFLQNAYIQHEDLAICGSRGWEPAESESAELQDYKIYRRELIRMQLSLDAAVRAGDGKNILVMMHFPPFSENGTSSEFTKLFQEYTGIKKVIYGHLHGKEAFASAKQGVREGIQYQLVSADYLNFDPVQL